MQEFIEKIGTVCKACGYEFYTDYSGRGMFGRTCIGICFDHPLEMLVNLTEHLTLMEEKNILYQLGSVCMDELGRQKIVYFPELDCGGIGEFCGIRKETEM